MLWLLIILSAIGIRFWNGFEFKAFVALLSLVVTSDVKILRWWKLSECEEDWKESYVNNLRRWKLNECEQYWRESLEQCLKMLESLASSIWGTVPAYHTRKGSFPLRVERNGGSQPSRKGIRFLVWMWNHLADKQSDGEEDRRFSIWSFAGWLLLGAIILGLVLTLFISSLRNKSLGNLIMEVGIVYADGVNSGGPT